MNRIILIAAIAALLGCSGSPAEQRENYFTSGQEYLQNRQYEESVIQFLNALKADEGFVPARLALVEAYQRMGNHRGAVLELRRTIEIDSGNAEAKLKLGLYYLAAGTRESLWFDEARKLAEEVLETDPDNVEARLLLGNSYAGLQDFDRSIEALQKALETDPDNLDAFLNIGAARFGRNDPAAAEQTFLEAVTKHPDSPKAHLGLGNFYIFSGNAEKAEPAFRKAFDLDRTNLGSMLALVRLYLALQQPAKAEAVFGEAIAAVDDSTGLQTLLANFYVAQGRGDEAAALLARLRQEQPDNRSVALQLGDLMLSQNRLDEAASIADSLLAGNDRDPQAHFLKGRVLAGRQEFEPALAEMDRAIELNPFQAGPHLLKTDLLQRRGALSEAEEAVRKILEFDRNNLPARARLAKLLAVRRETRADLDNALSEAQAVLAEMPNNPDALVARAEAYLALGRLDESRREFELLAEARPDNPFYLHRLGSIAALQGKYQAAVDFFRQALAENPNLTDAINDLVAVHLQQGDREAAIRELDQLAARSDQSQVFHIFRGRLHMGNRDYSKAEAEFRQAIGANPDDYQAYLLLGELMMVQNRTEEAIREVDQLIAKAPDFAPAYLLKAFYMDASKDQNGAIQLYRRTLDLFPDSAPGYGAAANNLAWILAERNESLTEARTLAQRARELDPENTHYADTLGWVYYKMGSYTLAVDQFLFMVNQGEPKAQHYHRLGMSYFRKGDTLLARQTLRKALEMSSDFEGADEAKRTLAELG